MVNMGLDRQRQSMANSGNRPTRHWSFATADQCRGVADLARHEYVSKTLPVVSERLRRRQPC
jgi:hypothetical protein